LAGKPGKIVQVAIAIPLFEIQTIEHALEVWLYAPLRLVVYESRDGNTFVAYNRFASLLAQYRHPEVARITHVMENSPRFSHSRRKYDSFVKGCFWTICNQTRRP
jgi:hypothetical protein